jgi:hypothetical protein
MAICLQNFTIDFYCIGELKIVNGKLGQNHPLRSRHCRCRWLNWNTA